MSKKKRRQAAPPMRPAVALLCAALLPCRCADALALRSGAMDLLRSINAPPGRSREAAEEELDSHLLGLVQTRQRQTQQQETQTQTHLVGKRRQRQRSKSRSAVARADPGFWDVISPTGVHYTDVKEGELGTCYFLAAVIGLARLHPNIIEDLFISRERWEWTPALYTTSWVVNGVRNDVVVTGAVPVNPTTVIPYFTKTNENADFWAVILEKSWAKIFGAYRNIAGGHMAEAFKALTQAPVEKVDHRIKSAILYTSMLEGLQKNWPIGASSTNNSIGIPDGHAYVVFDVAEDPTYGRVVTMYNPWARDVYAGVIPNPDKTDGFFNMTWDEYVSTMDHTTICQIHPGYQTSSVLLDSPGSETIMNAVLSVTLKSDSEFFVNLEWPNSRFLPGCEELSPVYTLAVSKLADPTNVSYATKPSPTMSNARVRVPGGPGDWILYIYAHFPNGGWLDFIPISIYGAEAATFHVGNHSGDVHSNYSATARTVFLAQENLCDTIEVTGRGLFSRDDTQLVNGMSIFLAQDPVKAGNHSIMYWLPVTQAQDETTIYTYGDFTWKMAPTMDAALKGMYYKGFDKDTDSRCVAETYSVPPESQFSNLMEDSASEYYKYLQDNAVKYAKYFTPAAAEAIVESDFGWGAGSLLETKMNFRDAPLLQTRRKAVRKVGEAAAPLTEKQQRQQILHQAAQRRAMSNIYTPEEALRERRKRHEKRKSEEYSLSLLSKTVPNDADMHCSLLIDRLGRLDNAQEIVDTQVDKYFPAEQVSIGAANDTCLESESTGVVYCSEYNHWDSIPNIMKQVYSNLLLANTTVTLMEQCIDRTDAEDHCNVVNLCDETLVVLCDGVDETGEPESIMLGPITPHFNGTSASMFCSCSFIQDN